MTHDNREPIRSDLFGFWLYVIAWTQARYIEQLELKAFCERNALNRRHRAAREVE